MINDPLTTQLQVVFHVEWGEDVHEVVVLNVLPDAVGGDCDEFVVGCEGVLEDLGDTVGPGFYACFVTE